ncbi:MAG: hypothetical protein M4579_005667 [Chaenotheca gracillima]|nr:MAG: hypothetical protein M4579_005667 [Chaenotheca gracillima]
MSSASVSTGSRPSGSFDDEESGPEKGLLERDEEQHQRNQQYLPLRKSFIAFRDRYFHFILVQVLLLTIYTGAFFSLVELHGGGLPGPSLIYSPAREALEYERVRFNATLVIDSPYNGPPSPEVDLAWHDLLDNMNIALPKSDLDRIGATSIPLPGDQNMFIAGLGVFHELHCLKRLRQYTWPEYYFPNLTTEDRRMNRLHTDHCIDVLRQAMMCRADISLFTLEWSEAELQPRADFSHEHECVNFDALYKWAGERRISAGTPGLLVHPLHGIAFPDGIGNRIGGSEDCAELSRLLPASTFNGDFAKRDLWSLFQAQVSPQCRVEPRSAQDVADALSVARTHGCNFAVLGGGTSPFRGASSAEGGITIDLCRMRSIDFLDSEPGLVYVAAGNRWADVYRVLDARNLSATGTRNSLTGVVGSILGGETLGEETPRRIADPTSGGISFFSQHHGWSCDNVAEFEVVLANSSIVNVTEFSHPDLFWALRGGGNNFGIVTRVLIEVFPQPPSWYTFQLWDMSVLDSVFKRLEKHTTAMPRGVSMIATTLGWSVPMRKFVLSERMVALQRPDLPQSLPASSSNAASVSSRVLQEHIYQMRTLEMSQKMDRMNKDGYYNFFGSMTVKSNAEVNAEIAAVFCDEVGAIANASGLQIYIVYNPLSVSTVQQMQRRGGNALGLVDRDGPLTVVNINLHWSNSTDMPRMRHFMRRMISRSTKAAKDQDMHHRYLFQNHAFEEQDVFAGYGEVNLRRLRRVRAEVDPSGVFQVLQPGFFKLGAHLEDAGKSEL